MAFAESGDVLFEDDSAPHKRIVQVLTGEMMEDVANNWRTIYGGDGGGANRVHILRRKGGKGAEMWTSLLYAKMVAVARSSDDLYVLPDPADMPFLDVESSNVDALAFDQMTTTGYVRFTSGDTYAYMDVRRNLWIDFYRADSVGGFLHSKVKGEFPYLKIPSLG
jgi:hypothetical protein